MAATAAQPPGRTFVFGSRAPAFFFLGAAAFLLLLVIFSFARAEATDDARRGAAAASGLALALGYIGWRDGRGFFDARVTPAEIELGYLFHSHRFSARDLVGVDLAVEWPNIFDALIAFDRRALAARWLGVLGEAASAEARFRVELAAVPNRVLRSARFDDERVFFALRDLLKEHAARGSQADFRLGP